MDGKVKEFEDVLAVSYCLRNHIKIYPVATNEVYQVKKGRKKVTLPKMKIVIDYDGSRKTGQMIFKQDEELYSKIQSLYIHYWHSSQNYITYLKNLI